MKRKTAVPITTPIIFNLENYYGICAQPASQDVDLKKILKNQPLLKAPAGEGRPGGSRTIYYT